RSRSRGRSGGRRRRRGRRLGTGEGRKCDESGGNRGVRHLFHVSTSPILIPTIRTRPLRARLAPQRDVAKIAVFCGISPGNLGSSARVGLDKRGQTGYNLLIRRSA